MTWSARRRAWEAKRLGPALDAGPGAPDPRSARSATPRSTASTAHGRGQPAATTQRRRQRRCGRRRRPDRGRPARRAPPPGARPLGRLRSAPRRRPAGRAAVHPRHPPDRLPEPALDDADVRRASARPRTRTRRFRQLLGAGQTGLSIAYDMPTLYGYDTRRPRGRGRVRDVRRRACRSLADMEVLLDGLPLDRVSTSMTINSPAAPIWAMYIVAAEKAGVPRAALEGTTPERHPQGVRRPEGVPVPAGAVDAPRDRHDRVRDARDAALEHDLDQRLPHPRGRLDGDPGAGLHDRRRDGLRRGGASSAACAVDDFAPRLSFFFNSHSDFFEEIAKFRASRRIWYKLMTERYRRRERALDLDAVPHPDRRRVADAAAAAQQPDPGRAPGARGRPRRHAVAPHRRLRRGARGPDRRGGPPRPPPAADHRRGDRASRTRSTRSAARGSSRRSPNETEREVWRYLDEIDRRGGMVAAIDRGLPAARDRRRGVSLPARARRRRAADRRGQRLRRRRPRRRPIPVLAGAARVVRAPHGPARADAAASATRRRSRLPCAGLREAARRPGIERDEPDAALHPLRGGLRARSASSARSCARSSASTANRWRSRRCTSTRSSLLEDERDAWRPLRAAEPRSSDEQLERPVDAVNGWSGRDLMGHLVALAAGRARRREGARHGRERSAAKERADADWEQRGGDAVNDEIQRDWAGEPIGEVRAEFERSLRASSAGYLTVVPEARWIKNADHQRFFIDETLDHYDEHRKDLDAILAAAGTPALVTAADARRTCSTTRPRSSRTPSGRPAADGSTVEWSIAGITFAAISRRPGRVPARPAGREGGVADAGHAPTRAGRGLGRVLAAGAGPARDRPGDRMAGERLAPRRRRVVVSRVVGRSTNSAARSRRGRGATPPPGRRAVDVSAAPRRGRRPRSVPPIGLDRRRAGLDRSRRRLGGVSIGRGQASAAGRVLAEPELHLRAAPAAGSPGRPSAACPGRRTRSSGCS